MEGTDKEVKFLQGIGVSPGIVFSKVFLLDDTKVEVRPYSLYTKAEVEYEIDRFRNAIMESKQQLERIKEEIKKRKISEPISIIDAYQMILDDR
ncbi:MAG: phosphoenolpyruvate-utilizing N-terminal domain-containing protein, partial [Thermodesulfobacteriota bacterium]|nr:phosphoenolpyruvate-utilizing N-terminal domain-containing protein [Thermodesulfobacteriota bacterium]